MGAVYLAFYLGQEREVTVEALLGSEIGTEGRVRLMREAHSLIGLNDANIVLVHDAASPERDRKIRDVPSLVMESRPLH